MIHPGLRGLAQQHTLGFQSGWRQCANNPRFIFPNSIPVSSVFRFFNLPFTQTVVSSSNPLVSSPSPHPTDAPPLPVRSDLFREQYKHVLSLHTREMAFFVSFYGIFNIYEKSFFHNSVEGWGVSLFLTRTRSKRSLILKSLVDLRKVTSRQK